MPSQSSVAGSAISSFPHCPVLQHCADANRQFDIVLQVQLTPIRMSDQPALKQTANARMVPMLSICAARTRAGQRLDIMVSG